MLNTVKDLKMSCQPLRNAFGGVLKRRLKQLLPKLKKKKEVNVLDLVGSTPLKYLKVYHRYSSKFHPKDNLELGFVT